MDSAKYVTLEWLIDNLSVCLCVQRCVLEEKLCRCEFDLNEAELKSHRHTHACTHTILTLTPVVFRRSCV